MNMPSIFATRHEEKLGAAIALLSMDRIVPFYQWLGVPTEEPSPLVSALRAAIIANRRAFAADQSRVPNLWRAVETAFIEVDGTPALTDLQAWIEEVFVYDDQDLRQTQPWFMLLGLTFRNDDRWRQLILPEPIKTATQERLSTVFSRDEIHALADTVDAEPLSAWDVEMYSLHGFDEDENDPYNWVLEVATKHRVQKFLAWLRPQLSETQSHIFRQSVLTLANTIEATQHYKSFEW